MPIAAAIAARTKTIRIGTSVMLLPFHNPVRLAEEAATVDVISGGRLELGAGVGYKVEEFAGFAVSSKERGARTNECLEILARLWEGETCGHLHQDDPRLQKRRGRPLAALFSRPQQVQADQEYGRQGIHYGEVRGGGQPKHILDAGRREGIGVDQADQR